MCYLLRPRSRCPERTPRLHHAFAGTGIFCRFVVHTRGGTSPGAAPRGRGPAPLPAELTRAANTIQRSGNERERSHPPDQSAKINPSPKKPSPVTNERSRRHTPSKDLADVSGKQPRPEWHLPEAKEGILAANAAQQGGQRRSQRGWGGEAANRGRRGETGTEIWNICLPGGSRTPPHGFPTRACPSTAPQRLKESGLTKEKNLFLFVFQ